MTTKIVKYALVICEGCGAVHGMPDQYPGSGEARRGALDAGWSLVPKRLADGRPARVQTNEKALVNITRAAHDVCPNCVATFEPAAYPVGGGGGKAWWTERIERLEAENARLRAGR